MSLFDLIQNPVTDFANSKQLAKHNERILRDWAFKCYGVIEQVPFYSKPAKYYRELIEKLELNLISADELLVKVREFEYALKDASIARTAGNTLLRVVLHNDPNDVAILYLMATCETLLDIDYNAGGDIFTALSRKDVERDQKCKSWLIKMILEDH
jgi:hypothetical protein